MTTTSASTAAMTAVGTRPMTSVNGSTLTTAITAVNMTTTVTTMTTATTGTGSGSVVATAGLAATTTAAIPRLQGGFTFPSVPTSGVVASSGVPVPGAAPSIPMGYGNAYPVMTSMQCGYGFGYSAASPSGL
ncbi:hypothetical protein PF011_g26011 [Phytophthora fragariae]|uniref:Uncharacterized protein n=1 Tax=Phytophthora fragariae TaxID=53985 RepID=A0A6A3HPC1_9STRA|nr:hypothetical protein PF011_g26011 [Phytophthora fragariae]